MSWLKAKQEEQLHEIIQQLEICQRILNEEMRMPLNVACSAVLKGVLVRHGAQIDAKGQAQLGQRMTPFSGVPTLSQISALHDALAIASHCLNINDPKTALCHLRAAEQLLFVPPKSVRFPTHLFDVGAPLGVCGDAFVCERSNIVFNLHAYHNTKDGFVATETVSAKSADASLMQVWEHLDSIMPQITERAEREVTV